MKTVSGARQQFSAADLFDFDQPSDAFVGSLVPPAGARATTQVTPGRTSVLQVTQSVLEEVSRLMSTRRTLTSIGLALACAGACGTDTTASNEQLASAAMLTLSATAEPDTVALDADITLTLTAKNTLPVGILAPGPCPSIPLRVQIVGADSVRRYTIVGAGVGCKALNGPATVRLEPGWTAAVASRGRAGTVLSPGLRPGSYRLRGVYEAPTDTAFSPWMSVIVLP